MSSIERDTPVQAPADERETRQYWRSVDRLLESPPVAEANALEAAAQAGRTPEFPEGADLPPDEVSRRTMMGLMGASFAMAGLAGCRRPVEHIMPYVDSPETTIPGVPKFYATTMPVGTDSYGLVVESHEGRPTKIEGNELHPASQGAATVWAQASVLNLYDPDRSPYPLHQSEEGGDDHGGDDHGEGGYESTPGRSSWEEFEAFWTTHAESLGDGAGLAVLTRGSSSPTIDRLRTEFLTRFPSARWTVYDAVGDANVFRGVEMAAGGAYRPVYHLDKARVIVTLDADILHTESDAVRNAKGFAASRQLDNGEPSNRLYSVEPGWTATGGTADHRLRVRRGDVPGFAAALARALGVSAPAGDAPAHVQDKVQKIAADLQSAGSGALVVAGRTQDPGVHAVALAINQALGSMGTTVTLHDAGPASYGSDADVTALVDGVDDGSIQTLVIVGGNPAYDGPRDVRLDKAIRKVPTSIHLSSFVDETSRHATWHLNGTHFLEAWGDAQGADGTLSVVQPLIAPLFNGRSDIELVNLLTTGAHRSGAELVRETWNAALGLDEKGWRRILHDGLATEPAPAPAAATIGDVSGVEYPEAPAADGMEVTIDVSRSAWDGRFSNNAWMQELPDPTTKVTWDNAALVSHATAEALDVERGDVLLLTLNNGKVEAPVFVVPGHADGTIGLSLGYGRSVGRASKGVGYNASRVRSAASPWYGTAVQVRKTGRSHELVQTQEHWDMEGRHHVEETTLASFREHPEEFNHKINHHKLPREKSHQLFEYVDYSQGHQWGMAIDLTTCTGCNACIIACQSENNIPVVGKEQVRRGREMHWLRVDRYFVTGHGVTGHGHGDGHNGNGHGDAGHGDAGHNGDHSHGASAADEAEMVFQPIPCMHCENAPCEQVCPVAATAHDDEGLNHMIYNRCIGTRYCSNNCPYKVRRFNFFNYTVETPEIAKIAANPDVTVRSRGVMEKCSFCVQRLTDAKIAAKAEDPHAMVADGDVQTACQQTCPTGAISFGNINDAESMVSKDKAKDRNYTLLDVLNNWPRTSFLAKVRNPHPDWTA